MAGGGTARGYDDKRTVRAKRPEILAGKATARGMRGRIYEATGGKSQEISKQEGPRRLQKALGGPRRPQEGPGARRKLQAAW